MVYLVKQRASILIEGKEDYEDYERELYLLAKIGVDASSSIQSRKYRHARKINRFHVDYWKEKVLSIISYIAK